MQLKIRKFFFLKTAGHFVLILAILFAVSRPVIAIDPVSDQSLDDLVSDTTMGLVQLLTLFQIEPQFLLEIHPDHAANMNAFAGLASRYRAIIQSFHGVAKSKSPMTQKALAHVIEVGIFQKLRASGFSVSQESFEKADEDVLNLITGVAAFEIALNIKARPISDWEEAIAWLDSHPDLHPFQPHQMNASFPDPVKFMGELMAEREKQELAKSACRTALVANKATDPLN